MFPPKNKITFLLEDNFIAFFSIWKYSPSNVVILISGSCFLRLFSNIERIFPEISIGIQVKSVPFSLKYFRRYVDFTASPAPSSIKSKGSSFDLIAFASSAVLF
ncbi:hypothetical protein FGO68_gene9119 [Halteria grandinella]|uniref:Uncharacterized protein n=1 Tax=Halteria grandinella TaxID=5974 RepID=A0A8J8NBN1_HALGN|nr:hypothetical protein FGO68_gene9119 [Halteria grandinella]